MRLSSRLALMRLMLRLPQSANQVNRSYREELTSYRARVAEGGVLYHFMFDRGSRGLRFIIKREHCCIVSGFGWLMKRVTGKRCVTMRGIAWVLPRLEPFWVCRMTKQLFYLAKEQGTACAVRNGGRPLPSNCSTIPRTCSCRAARASIRSGCQGKPRP